MKKLILLNYGVNVEAVWPEIKSILFRLLSLVILAPIFGYGILYSCEILEKAWKSGNRKKKWFAITLTLLFLQIALGWLG